MKVAVVASYAPSLLNFRKELLLDLVGGGHSVIAMAPEGDAQIRAGLLEIGVGYQPYPLVRNSVSPAKDLATLLFLARFFRRNHVDVCFTYTIKPTIYGAWAASLADVPRITAMITGLGYAFMDADGFKRKALLAIVQKLYQNSLAHCQTVLFQNEDDKELFQDLGLLSQRTELCVVNGSGVDLAHHQSQRLPDGPPHYLLIARLLREKGIREFGEAAKLVVAQIPDATFEVVGPPDASPGGLNEDELATAQANGVIFSGSTDDVRQAFARSTCFVLPSYREGTPRTVLEAMAASRPVVTTDVPGCRQTMLDGKTGILVPPQDAASLAHAMCEIGKDRTRALEMGRQGRLYVERKYDVKFVAKATVDAILKEREPGK